MSNLNAGIHDLLSSKLLLPLWQFQQRVRPSQRSILQEFSEGLRFRRAAINWDAEKKRKWILNRLHFTARRAYRYTIFYRDLFNRIGFDPQADFSFEDFSQLPILEREDVHRAGKDLISSSVPAHQLQKNSTGGSTGVPTEVWMGPEEIGWQQSGSEFFLQRIGVPKGTRTGWLWGHHLDPVASDRLHDRIRAFVFNFRWFDCFRLSPEVLDRYHQEFEKWQPACILAYASALGNYAEHILERGHRLSHPPRCFVTGAEKLLPKHREVIEKAFQRPIHEQYGSRDVGLMGFQVNPTRTLHYEIDWVNVMLEPESHQQDSAILITKFHADGMPMIRYRVGDMGRFSDACRPGQPVFVLDEVLGRDTDRIWLPNGHWIHGIQMPHMMKDYPVREFMFIQHSDYSVQLMVVPKNNFAEDSRRKIEATVASNLPGLDVAIEIVNEIPRTKANKWRPVVSEVRSYPRGRTQ